jgi:hypothetical protein
MSWALGVGAEDVLRFHEATARENRRGVMIGAPVR